MDLLAYLLVRHYVNISTVSKHMMFYLMFPKSAVWKIIICSTYVFLHGLQKVLGNPIVYDHISSGRYLLYLDFFHKIMDIYIHRPSRAELHCWGLLHIEYLIAMQFARHITLYIY